MPFPDACSFGLCSSCSARQTYVILMPVPHAVLVSTQDVTSTCVAMLLLGMQQRMLLSRLQCSASKGKSVICVHDV